MKNLPKNMRLTVYLLVLMSPIAWAFPSQARADATVEFVEADAGANAKGVVGYVVANDGGGEVTTFVLADGSCPVITSTLSIGCIEIVATVGAHELALLFTGNNEAQFIRDGLVVAEVSPNGSGGWNHWGTETLAGNGAFEALLVATGDTNLLMLAQANCAAMGYWDCVLKVLECEGYTLACLVNTFMPGEGDEACAVPSSPDCILFLDDLVVEHNFAPYSPCAKAKACWKEASDNECVPW